MKKLFTIAAALLFGLSAMAEETTSGTYSVRTLDDVTSTWDFGAKTTGSSQKITSGTTDNGIYFVNTSNSNQQLASSGGLSNKAESAIYLPVISSASAGTISMTTYSTSDSRWLQLFVNDTAAADSKRLWSKPAADASDGKKGPQSFAFTASDLTLLDGVYYLQFRSNNTEMKIATMTITLTNGDVYESGATKYTVSFYDGETLLGTERVVEGEAPAKAADYQAKDGYTFDGWFNDAAFTSPASLTAAITADKAFYGKWTKEVVVVSTPSTSVNIEQLILDNSKNYNIQGAFDAAHITYASLDALDSLNASKDANNEPFLGLKLKTAGAYVQVALKSGNVLRVKFGNVAADIKVNGTTVAKDLVQNVATGYEYTATEDVYVKIETTTSGTVVLKQIMINEPIAAVNQPAVTNNTNLATLTLDGVAIAGFSAGKKEYTVEVAAGSAVPVVAATAADEAATVGAISQAASVPGDATFTVTAADGTTTATYTIHFVLPREIEYLTAPYETTIPADFKLPAWLTGCAVNLAYMGSDTVVCGHDVIRFEQTDTISMYINSCDSVILDLSATGSRTIAIAVNGVEKANSGKFNSKTLNTLGAFIHSNEPVVVNIYGVEVSGGTTISRIKVTAYDTATGMENVQTQKAVKVIENGQIVIIKNGVRYNALGARL